MQLQREEKQLRIRKAEEMRLIKKEHFRLQTEGKYFRLRKVEAMKLRKEGQLRLHIIGKDRQKIEEEQIRSIALVDKNKTNTENEARTTAA